MTTCTKHDWVRDSDNPMKVICSDCGTNQYISKLTKAQKRRLAESSALKSINEIAAKVGITRESLDMPEIVAETVPDDDEPELVIDPSDILMWVGEGFYNTPEDFINESKKMGACKRVPALPRGIVPGGSSVFLAHSKAINGEDPGIFAYFIVKGIVAVVDPEIDLPEELKKRGVTEWTYQFEAFGFNNERKCGNLSDGGTYLLSEKDMEAAQDLAEASSMKGQIIVLSEPIPLVETKMIRGYKYIDGAVLLTEGFTESEWFERARETYAKNERAIRKYHHLIRKKNAQKNE